MLILRYTACPDTGAPIPFCRAGGRGVCRRRDVELPARRVRHSDLHVSTTEIAFAVSQNFTRTRSLPRELSIAANTIASDLMLSWHSVCGISPVRR